MVDQHRQVFVLNDAIERMKPVAKELCNLFNRMGVAPVDGLVVLRMMRDTMVSTALSAIGPELAQGEADAIDQGVDRIFLGTAITSELIVETPASGGGVGTA